MSVSSSIQSDSSVYVKHTHTGTRVLFGGTLVCVEDFSVCVKSCSKRDPTSFSREVLTANVCCSVLQRVAVFRSVFYCFAVCLVFVQPVPEKI